MVVEAERSADSAVNQARGGLTDTTGLCGCRLCGVSRFANSWRRLCHHPHHLSQEPTLLSSAGQQVSSRVQVEQL